MLERRHRQRARVEDRIRDDKDTGLAKLPFKAFALNEVWLEIVMLAHDLIVWTQALVLDGELAKSRTETTALPAAARRRPARVLRPPRQAAPPRSLAVDRSAQGRVREAQDAPRRDRLTTSRPATPARADLPATGRDHLCQETHSHTHRHSRANDTASDRRVHRHHRAPQNTATAGRTHLRALTARSGLRTRAPDAHPRPDAITAATRPNRPISKADGP